MPRLFDGTTPGPGRPKGSLNKATKEIKDFWEGFYGSPTYLKSAKARILKGRAPHLEAYWLKRLFGEKSELEVTGPEGRPLGVMFGGRYRPDGSHR